MPRKMESKLDKFTEQLRAMDADGAPIAEMQQWLEGQGVSVSANTISRFLGALEKSEPVVAAADSTDSSSPEVTALADDVDSPGSQERMLELISNCSVHCRELDRAFKKNPPPELDTLVKVFKTLIYSLAVDGAKDTKKIVLADKLSHTAMEFITVQARVEHKKVELDQAERKLQLMEKKAKAFDEAQAVQKRKMTPEEKEAEWRRIFGMA